METFENEIVDFLQKWPDVEFIDLIFTDVNATPRGKRIPVSALPKVVKGIYLPVSTISLNIVGSVVEEAGLGEEIGEPDNICFPVLGSLAPTAKVNVGQLLLTMMDAQGKGTNPLAIRNILSDLVDKLHYRGQFPVIALELEFYLLDKKRAADGSIQAPINPVKNQRENTTEVYDVNGLDDYEDFLTAFNTQAERLNLNTSGMLIESAPGQFELNFNHQQDVLNACDQLIYAKRLIRQVATQYDFDVTFMAKPFATTAGSGKHIHISVVDQQGDNLLSDKDGNESPLFSKMMAAMLAMIPSSIALLCPNINSYRRFSTGMYTPVKANWGKNHRGVALRVPSSNGQNRRIEHRIAGADVNPYILTAVVISSVLASEHFSPQQCPPALDEKSMVFPLRMPEALDKLLHNEMLNEYLTPEFLKLYKVCKESELAEFEKTVTALEVDWMLYSA
ncbi:glutamine synthetase [Psychromonas sp. MB-3u-54]|uniref:glutamine synthetase family protein n=1 Tax=Psychromonas sp. MB-3u-54 TaxID=2058319 RepID=UPI000C328936|nr:glutamine synthetase family protein [Psychromonas sp. MB-3u-54]PKH01389.1 glutamine synthetase [Psychromonas sp. MB-3u-54]